MDPTVCTIMMPCTFLQQCKSQPHRVRILEKVFLSKVTQSERAKDQRINFTDEHKKIGRHRLVDSSARYILVRIPCKASMLSSIYKVEIENEIVIATRKGLK